MTSLRETVAHFPAATRLRADLQLLGPAALLAVGAGLLVSSQAHSAAFILLVVAAATVGQWSLLRRAAGQPVPLVGILVVGINAVGALGYLFYPAIEDRAAVSAVIESTPEIYNNAAVTFVVASLSLTALPAAAYVLHRMATAGMSSQPRQKLAATVSSVRDAAAEASRIRPGLLAAIAIVPLACEVIAYTPGGVLSRGHYSAHTGPIWAVIAGSVLAPVGVVLASLLWVRPGSRFLGGVLVAAYFVVLLSLGTRQLSLLPFLALLAWLLRPGAASRRRTFALTALAVITTVLLLQLPLTLRALGETSGLGPYTAYLRHHPAVIFALDFPRIFGNVLFSFPLAGTTARIQALPHEWFRTAINPAPNGFTNWEQIKPQQRINAWTPTNGLGELRNYGLLYLSGFMLVTGSVLTGLQRWNARLPTGQAALAVVVGMGMTGALTFDLLQYNLRSGVRMLWYFALLSVLLHGFNSASQENADAETVPE